MLLGGLVALVVPAGARGSRSGAGVRKGIIGVRIGIREALEAAAERHHHLWASDGSDGGGGAGERSGRQRRGPRGDLRALPRLNGLYRLH